MIFIEFILDKDYIINKKNRIKKNKFNFEIYLIIQFAKK